MTTSEKKASKQQSDLIKQSAEIMTTEPAGEDMAFTHAILCQVGLPRSKVDGTNFLRQSGAAWINVQAGYLDEGQGPVLQQIPYGAMPRLALAWVSTYCLRNKEQEVPIGDSSAATSTKRPDRSEALRKAHEAAAYDKWFREEVQESIDDPRPSIPHEQVEAHFEARRARLQELIK